MVKRKFHEFEVISSNLIVVTMFFNDFISKLPTNTSNLPAQTYWVMGLMQVSKNKMPIFYTAFNVKVNKFFFNNFNWSGNQTNVQFFIYFLRKEVFYTKLKYSRVPQFDTSSGASASFLSGFYGFLVCEKFGFELIDSGDFFFLILYLIFYAYIFITLAQIFNHTSNLLSSLLSLFRSIR